MKCPKCGYNSFEIHDACKKCGIDLTGYKEIHGLKSIVLPLETRTSMAGKLMAEIPQDDHAAAVEVPVDMFSFDISDDEAAPAGAASSQDDPFSFDDSATLAAPGGRDYSFAAAQTQADEDTSFGLLDPLSGSPLPAPATGTKAASALDGFSWDDTPETAPGGAAAPDEDFSSLFGDTDDTAKK